MKVSDIILAMGCKFDVNIDERFSQIAEVGAANAAHSFLVNALYTLDGTKFGSEIELLMALGFLINADPPSHDVECDFRGGEYWSYRQHEELLGHVERWSEPFNAHRVYVFPQVLALGYRVDFMIYGSIMGRINAIAVECDGHDFHEKTKEQAQRDKQRDRDLLSVLIPVMRFTGSEIYKDPIGCSLKAVTYFDSVARTLDPPSEPCEDDNMPF